MADKVVELSDEYIYDVGQERKNHRSRTVDNEKKNIDYKKYINSKFIDNNQIDKFSDDESLHDFTSDYGN